MVTRTFTVTVQDTALACRDFCGAGQFGGPVFTTVKL
jgi:hypothetical protein